MRGVRFIETFRYIQSPEIYPIPSVSAWMTTFELSCVSSKLSDRNTSNHARIDSYTPSSFVLIVANDNATFTELR